MIMVILMKSDLDTLLIEGEQLITLIVHQALSTRHFCQSCIIGNLNPFALLRAFIV
jgi:hypothetical protein